MTELKNCDKKNNKINITDILHIIMNDLKCKFANVFY